MARVFVIESVDVSSIENVSLDTERCKQNQTHGLSRTKKDHMKFSDSKRSRLFALSAKSRVYKTNNAIKNCSRKAELASSTNEKRRNTITNTIINRHSLNKNKKEDNNFNTGLELEKANNEERSRKRIDIFQHLISGANVEVSWIKGLLTAIGIILAGFLSTILFTIIPVHDLVQHPEYWYEIIFHGMIGHTLISIGFCYPASWLMNISQMRKPRTLAVVFMFSQLAGTAWIVLSYFIWTHILLFEYPVPFCGYIAYSIDVIVPILVIFFGYPKRWRRNKIFKKRMKFALILTQYLLILDLANTIVTEILRAFPNQYQPVIALLLPLNRELILLTFPKLIRKTASGDENGAEIILNYAVCAQHTIWTCYNLGSFTTNVTSWVLMGIDFSLNIFLCSRIVWRRIQKDEELDEQISSLQHLASYELAEFHAPLSFMLMFIVAYYGPNSTLLGNISNDYWGFKPIQNIKETIQNMFTFFLADFASSVVSAIMLWSFCKINLWKVFVLVQKEFATAFIILISEFQMVVGIYSELHCEHV